MRSRLLVPLLSAALLLGGPPGPGRAGEEGELLLPGQVRERSIAPGESDVYRVVVADAPVLVEVEQRGIDLMVEARGPADPASFAVDAPNHDWGPELLLLEGAGEHRIEIHPREQAVPAGRYTVSVEALTDATEAGERRRAALAAMSRAGREAAGEAAEAQGRALTAYREARQEWQAQGDPRLEAEALHAAAALEHQAGELRLALPDYQAALALWREVGEPQREALALTSIGLVQQRLGDVAAARGALEEALALWQRLGERLGEAEVRMNLCLLEQMSGSLPAALACYEEAQAIFRELGDGSREALLLNSIGGVYDLMGDPDAALARYEQALALRRAVGDRRGEAQTLNNLAVVHRTLGEWQEALSLYEEARRVLAPLGDRAEEAKLLNNVGFAYNSLGEPQRALAFLGEALELRRAIGDRRGEIGSRNNLGLARRSLGQLDRALDEHRRALELAVALGDPRQEAVTRLRLAEVSLEQRDAAAALGHLERALALLAGTGNRPAETQALYLQGRALALAGRPAEAQAALADVLARRRALRDRAGEAETLQALAALARTLGRSEEARARAEAAIALVEDLRGGLLQPDLRASFLATRQSAYTLLIDLDMDRHLADPRGGHDREAFAVSERARARSLLDVLYQGGTGGSPGGGAGAATGLLERRQSLRHRLSAKAGQQLGQGAAPAVQGEAGGREIEALLAELDGVEAEIRRQDPRYAAFSQVRPLGAEEAARLLDPDTLLLEYALGEERSFLWLVGAGAVRSFPLPGEKAIEQAAQRAYEELSTVEIGGPGDAGSAAEALSRLLLEPVWAEAGRAKRLVVVADAALQIIPFGALPVPLPGQSWKGAGDRLPLLLDREVVYLPSATALALQRQRLERRPPAAKWAAVLADPVFAADDPRLARRPAAAGQPSLPMAQTAAMRRGSGTGDPLLPAFPRLPATRSEAETIARLAPAGEVWKALDFEASREAVISGRLRPFRTVHFATHGLADTRDPELSGLVLSRVDAAGRPQEGLLRLPDIYELDLAADLVVLSGCRTALGKQVRGEGLMGLTRGFLYAGVPRVVASLWRVEDRTTAELMSRFYRAMWQDGLAPAAALHAAQRSLRRDPRYRAPYSWAGFVLQGDWR